jgi:hypothetical protein
MAYEHTTPDDPEVFVTSIAAEDATLLAVQEGRLIEWDLDLGSWHAAACQVSGRSLTELEVQQYRVDEAAMQRCEQ